MKTENYLAKWLSGELSEEELNIFKKSSDYDLYKKIIERTDMLEAPDYDSDTAYKKLKEKLDSVRKPRIIKLNTMKVFLRIAAVIAVIFGTYYFMAQRDTPVATGFAESTLFTLPDASEVILNADSEARYKKSSWASHREVKLRGEAYFKVNKGKTFEVISENGVVTVIGTQFNVKSRENYFEVVCYEGLVKVTHELKEVLLSPGNSFKVYGGTIVEEMELTDTEPSWLNHESIFKSVPLVQVLDEIERQFDIRIQTETVDTNRLFTGGFSHKNLDAALRSVCVPMNLAFVKNQDNSVRIYAN
ncbi:FecR family protein [Ascidiimonas aurantiaca]|uniref:FecR family protein n=1 Tax=Ascidiimonas aurantiaca TaxID=1685432 RepID=UPI0030ECCF0F